MQLRTLTLQQRHTQVLFQLGDLLAHCGLADVQGQRGLGKAAAVHHFEKAA
ncbi:hypothetical protein D3C72_2417750 [compost metagenome]